MGARAPPPTTRLLVSPVFHAAIPGDEACEPPEKEAGILWDAVCLIFLLIQPQIFLSYYHFYVVADLEAAQALASILWPNDGKGLLIGKDPDAGKD